MTKPITKEPIEAFGAELMSALLEGSRRRILIPFKQPDHDGRKMAHSFVRRLNTLRQRMRQESHRDYNLAMRAKLSIKMGSDAVRHGGPKEWEHNEDGSLGALVIIEPKDSEFLDDLTRAGISVSKVDQPIHVAPKDDESLEDFLSTLHEESSKNKS